MPTDGSDLGLSTDPVGVTSEAGAGARVVIWGTDVVVTETQEQFRRFITQYTEEEEGESFYIQRLEEVVIFPLIFCYIRFLKFPILCLFVK